MAKKPTKAESEHMGRVAALGCLICGNEAEVHHINAQGMGMRSSPYETVPLCHSHHRTGGHGVAVHAGKKTWEQKFGTEAELLQRTRELLGL